MKTFQAKAVYRTALLLLMSLQCVTAQTAPSDGDAEKRAALAKAALNPVASLISVPFQNTSNLLTGPFDRAGNMTNIQPVVPFKLGTRVNLITRTIIPVFANQPNPTSPNGWAGGLGDLNPTFFLSPQKPGKVIWGVGPALVLPTATYHLLGQGKWSAGPGAVVLAQPGKWTVGGLANIV